MQKPKNLGAVRKFDPCLRIFFVKIRTHVKGFDQLERHIPVCLYMQVPPMYTVKPEMLLLTSIQILQVRLIWKIFWSIEEMTSMSINKGKGLVFWFASMNHCTVQWLSATIWNVAEFWKHGPWISHDAHAHRWAKNNGNCHDVCTHWHYRSPH